MLALLGVVIVMAVAVGVGAVVDFPPEPPQPTRTSDATTLTRNARFIK
jgi:hypothetical protein